MTVKRQKSLTPRQKKVLDFIRKFAEENGYSPSFGEIAKYLKKSISTVQHFVEELENKAYIHKEENVARGISLNLEKSGRIFLLGYIAAGKPIEPIENPEPIEIPLSLITGSGEYYALKVKGDSMIEDGIMNSDIVVIKHQLTAEPGDTVVAVTEKGATLKVLGRKNGKIILQPRNPKYEIIIPKKLEIRGKFVGLIRST